MPRFALRRPRGFLAIAALAAASTLAAEARAQSIQPTPVDSATVQIVAKLLEVGHLSKPTINDEISKRWVKNYIKSLDPQKIYFLQADVDEFHTYDTKLDETIANGDLSFAKLVFDRFLKRSDERLADAMDILKQKPDFTIKEAIVDDPDLMPAPKTSEEAKDRVRKLIKFSLLQRKIAKTEEAEAIKQVTIQYKDLNRMYRQYDNTDVLERYLTALTTAVDPHSSYMGPKELEDMFQQRLHLTLDGIGASLLQIDGYPVVQEVVPGGAADKDSRLQIDDKIVGVIKEDGSRESFVEKKLSDVVRKIRGPRGTKVKIVVIPDGSTEEKVYELTRQKIDLASDKAKGKVVEFKAAEGEKPHKFGVINIPSFYGDTAAVMQGDPDAASLTRDCRRLLDEFKKQGVEAVIIDVRGNPGGLLDEAISLSGLFIDKGPVVQVREAQSVKHRDDEDEGTSWDGPLAVVIDHYCASASEIFAGVIKDYGRGLVIGDSSTYGKGTVQHIMQLNERLNLRNNAKIPNLGALKLTIQQFYLPDGESTQIKGVLPHIHIPSVSDQSDAGEGKSDTALKYDKVAPLAHDRYNRVTSDLVARLVEKDEARRKASPKFQEEEKFIAKVIDRKKRHEVSLNEEQFRAETRAEDESEDLKPKVKGKKGRARRGEIIWEPGYYNDEVLAIVADYVTLGSRLLMAAPVRVSNLGAELPQMP